MKLVLSLHILKTAGTSLYAAYRQVYGDRLLHHNKSPEKVYAMTKAEIEASYDIVHGHLNLGRLAHLIGPDTLIVTFLRDPVQRVISSYYFHSRPETRNPLAREVQDKKMSLAEFAAMPQQQNLQSKMIGPVGRERVNFYGLAERYKESVTALSRLLEVSLDVGIEANRNPRKSTALPYDLPQEIIDKIRAGNQRDIALYEWILSSGSFGARGAGPPVSLGI